MHVDLALGVEDANIPYTDMQIDPAVLLVKIDSDIYRIALRGLSRDIRILT